jgi:hypothetical protein
MRPRLSVRGAPLACQRDRLQPAALARPSAGAPESARSREIGPGKETEVSNSLRRATPAHLGRYRGYQSQSLLNDHGLEVEQSLPQSFRYNAANRELEIAVFEAVNADRHMTLLQSPPEVCPPKQHVHYSLRPSRRAAPRAPDVAGWHLRPVKIDHCAQCPVSAS